MIVAALLDVENVLFAERRISAAAAQTALAELMGRVRRFGELRFAVGSCDFWLARLVWPATARCGVRLFPGPIGHDRADADLLRRGADIPPSAELVVIASGDAVFTPLARQQRDRGRTVVVAAHAGRLARCLRSAADEVLWLPGGSIATAP
jgi:hypothetical protein